MYILSGDGNWIYIWEARVVVLACLYSVKFDVLDGYWFFKVLIEDKWEIFALSFPLMTKLRRFRFFFLDDIVSFASLVIKLKRSSHDAHKSNLESFPWKLRVILRIFSIKPNQAKLIHPLLLNPPLLNANHIFFNLALCISTANHIFFKLALCILTAKKLGLRISHPQTLL